MCRVWKVVLPALVAALFLTPNPAYAQTGTIAGQARDEQGAALPGVTVEVTSPALIEKVRSTTTDPDGRYQITALPVGTYEVTFTLQNFATFKRPNVNVSSDFTANVVASMKVGALKDVVNVVAEAPIVDVQNARVQHVFTGTEIADLPTQRDIPSLLNLVPSLTSSQTRGVCSGGVGTFCNPTVPMFNSHTSILDSVDGVQSGQNQGRIMVDGMSINMGRAAGGINDNVGMANGIVLDTAAAQEVSFTLSGALGESETGGASINIVPRTGGNRYAGSYYTSYTNTHFFDRNRDSRLTWAPNDPNPQIANQGYNYDYQISGSFGGPIVKDRLWFYTTARTQASERYPGGGGEPGFMNLNEGLWGANYLPNRGNCNAPRSCSDKGWLTFTNEYKNASVRLTYQATQKNKFNINWDEQDSCTNPCYGMISIINSPESYFSLQSRPNRLMQLSWNNPLTNRLLFDAGISVVSTHQDQTKAREFDNPRTIPRVCESGTTVGRDEYGIQVNTSVTTTIGGAGSCNPFGTMNSGSINDFFPGTFNVINDDTYRSRASASYITGSHNAKIGFEGAYFAEKVRNEVNDLRLNYHYQTPGTTGTWNATTRSGNCLAAPATDIYSCGNMTLYYANEDPTNRGFLRPKPVGFQMNTGPSETDERVWFGALYLQDQWTLNRFTLNGALRYDHSESRYGQTCVGPDVFVPQDALQPTGSWCSTPAKGVRYNDITPRWGVAWDIFGTGKTSLKWNMGKYLGSAGFGGLYTDFNDARRSVYSLTRGWDDMNGNRIVECDFFNHLAHTSPQGDFCSALTTQGTTNPSTNFQRYGRAPNEAQLANADSSCGLKNSPAQHVEYCDLAGQNLMQGWGKRRSEWQLGIGIQHELLPRLSAEVTYNRRKYANITTDDTVLQGCDFYAIQDAAGTISAADPRTCPDGWMNNTDPTGLRNFFMLEAPLDPRLPGGGGYTIRGLNNQAGTGSLPGGVGDVTLVVNDLEYAWNGVDTNFVLRARGGLRISGGTSTGRSIRDTCYSSIDSPSSKGRDGHPGAGGCKPYRPFQTNVRANASYTIPWVDLLVGTVFQYRPGAERSATLQFTSSDVLWEPDSQYRSGTQFNTATGTTANFPGGVNLLDFGDVYGEGFRQWDLNFSKNIRFARKRVNIGVNVYNLFNTDAAVSSGIGSGYQDNYTAFRVTDANGNSQWVQDNPATAAVEVNDWGRVTNVATPRFLRFTVQFDF